MTGNPLLQESSTPDPHCENCDGRGCMGCVLREYDHDCQNDCPFCCRNDVSPRTDRGLTDHSATWNQGETTR